MLRPHSLAKTPPIPVAELVSLAEQTQPQTPVVYSIVDDELIASLAKIRAQASPFRKNTSTEQLPRTPTSSEKAEMLSSWRHRQDQDSPRKLDASIHGSSAASTSNSSSRSSEIIEEEIVDGSYGCYEDVDIDVDIDEDADIHSRGLPPIGDLSLQSIDDGDETGIIPINGGINDEFIFDLEL